MEANVSPHDHEDEYVLLELDGISGLVDIPPNAKYVLSGLDTLNPMLIIEDKLKLIGEYEETIGTCIAFTEQDTPVVHEEVGPSELNLFSGTRIIDSNQHPSKEVKPMCQLHKVLKFKLSPDSEIQGATAEQTDMPRVAPETTTNEEAGPAPGKPTEESGRSTGPSGKRAVKPSVWARDYYMGHLQ